MKSILKNKKGISVLISIIIISAVALIIATTAALTAIDQTQSGLHLTKSLETSAAAQSCLQQALFNLKTNPNYTGEKFNIADINCEIIIKTPVKFNGKTIQIQANDTDIYYKNLQVEIELQPKIKILFWQEI